jgi:hypothetical protein
MGGSNLSSRHEVVVCIVGEHERCAALPDVSESADARPTHRVQHAGGGLAIFTTEVAQSEYPEVAHDCRVWAVKAVPGVELDLALADHLARLSAREQAHRPTSGRQTIDTWRKGRRTRGKRR